MAPLLSTGLHVEATGGSKSSEGVEGREESGSAQMEDTAGGEDGDHAKCTEETIAALNAMLSMSVEEESACVELVATIRQFPEIIVGVAASLDMEVCWNSGSYCIQNSSNVCFCC